MPEMNNKDYRRFLEEKLESHNDRLKVVEKLTTEFTKISTILELHIEMGKKQDMTLEKINANLTTLNQETQKLGERVKKVESSVDKVTENDNISLAGLTKKIGWTIFTLIIGGLITWMFMVIRGK